VVKGMVDKESDRLENNPPNRKENFVQYPDWDARMITPKVWSLLLVVTTGATE
jgi:hypothetical protein